VQPEPAKPKKRHSLSVWNGDNLTKAIFVDGEDEAEPLIQKSDPRPERPPTAPAASPAASPAAPEKQSPSSPPEPPKPGKRGAGRQ
jgi:hypothetical protein